MQLNKMWEAFVVARDSSKPRNTDSKIPEFRTWNSLKRKLQRKRVKKRQSLKNVDENYTVSNAQLKMGQGISCSKGKGKLRSSKKLCV